MNQLTKLKASMILTLATVFSITTLVFALLTVFLFPGGSASFIISATLIMVLGFHLIQWLIGPKIIEVAYNVRPVESGEHQWLRDVLEKLARASGLGKIPQPMIARVDVPNAFAYGNALTGYKVAVTEGLLKHLPREEVEAVLGHEVGHIKHRDVELMMIVSIIPALIFWLGRSLMLIGWFGGGDDESEASLLPLLGIALIAVSFLFNFVILYISRLREYFADSHSASVVPGGAKKLQRALTRIMLVSGELKKFRINEVAAAGKFKALLISDPEVGLESRWSGDINSLVAWIKSQPKLMPTDFFATHPDPAKRLRFLDELGKSRFIT